MCFGFVFFFREFFMIVSFGGEIWRGVLIFYKVLGGLFGFFGFLFFIW